MTDYSDKVWINPSDDSFNLKDVGCVVARLQVPELTEGHKALLDFVDGCSYKLVVFIGCSPLGSTPRNPLDYEARSQMVRNRYPDAITVPLPDRSTDEAWSKQLDSLLGAILNPGESAAFYTGRDGFNTHYQGNRKVVVLESEIADEGTQVRKVVSKSHTNDSADFRRGAIKAATACFPVSYQAVDIAIVRDIWGEYGATVANPQPIGQELLLGQKPGEWGYRFPGGFVDPDDESLEHAAAREGHEECGRNLGFSLPRELDYITSQNMIDWRYEDESSCIKTCLFRAKYQMGMAEAGDDLSAVKWFDLEDLATMSQLAFEKTIRPNHRPLLAKLLAYEGRKRSWTYTEQADR